MGVGSQDMKGTAWEESRGGMGRQVAQRRQPPASDSAFLFCCQGYFAPSSGKMINVERTNE